MKATPTLPLNDLFGPTAQGEGPHCGRRCAFVRLGFCNLTCTWCDTPYTWDHARYDVAAQSPATPVADIRERLTALDVDTVVLSGGEPMMWVGSHALEQLLGGPWDWHVETNGTKTPPDWWPGAVAHTTVSPKLANSGVDEQRRIVPDALTSWSKTATYTGRVAFKFVIAQPRDLGEVEQLVREFQLPRRHVWVMPEGVGADTVLALHRAIAQPALDLGYNTTTRLHTLLWANERGR